MRIASYYSFKTLPNVSKMSPAAKTSLLGLEAFRYSGLRHPEKLFYLMVINMAVQFTATAAKSRKDLYHRNGTLRAERIVYQQMFIL